MEDSDLDEMSGLRRKRNFDEPQMDMTPMIDCTFLLLIFFIVAAKLDPEMALELAKAKLGAAVSEKNSAVILIVATNPDNPDIFLGPAKKADKQVRGTEDDQAEAIKQYIESEFSGATPKTAVILKTEKDVKFRHVLRVGRAISQGAPETSIHHAIIEQLQ